MKRIFLALVMMFIACADASAETCTGKWACVLGCVSSTDAGDPISWCNSHGQGSVGIRYYVTTTGKVDGGGNATDDTWNQILDQCYTVGLQKEAVELTQQPGSNGTFAIVYQGSQDTCTP